MRPLYRPTARLFYTIPSFRPAPHFQPRPLGISRCATCHVRPEIGFLSSEMPRLGSRRSHLAFHSGMSVHGKEQEPQGLQAARFVSLSFLL
ncbi:hypothetical protein GW17_00054377 [Ensete ventricosum]|nr:hypothetical protein GW17_00054377 [Ensete ventricosum]